MLLSYMLLLILVAAVVCILYCNSSTNFALGGRTVVHPKACIIAEAGPIIIGEGNLIEEQCKIINRYVLPFIFYRIHTIYYVCFTVFDHLRSGVVYNVGLLVVFSCLSLCP